MQHHAAVDSTSTGPERKMPEPYTEAETVERTLRWQEMCAEAVEFRAKMAEEFPDKPVATLDRAFASIVIANNLGEEWVEKNLDGSGKGKSGHLRKKPLDSLQRHQRYHRTMELARRIFELCPERFAGHLMDNLRQRDLQGAAFEADVVRMLFAGPFVVDLRQEFGKTGDDYDIDLWLRTDKVLAIEVKTRVEDGPYSDNAFERTLKTARGQLPPDGVGAVFVKIPDAWIGQAEYEANRAAVVAHFFHNTTRVHAVILVWDEWSPALEGTGYDWKQEFKIFQTANPDEMMAHVMDFFEKAWPLRFDIGPTAPF